MILKVLSGKNVRGKLTTNHPASSHGQPVLVVNGEAYSIFDAALMGWQLVKATARERATLERLGYRIPEAVE